MPVALVTSGAQSYAGVTTSQTGPDIANQVARGVRVTLVTTAIGTGNITLSIETRDPGSGSYIALLTGAPVSTNTTRSYVVSPSVPVVANASVNDCIGAVWRWRVVANNPNPCSYSVGFSTLP